MKLITSHIFKQSFLWMFFLILFLYGLSSRFNTVFLLVPIGFFVIYSIFNKDIIKEKISNSFLIYILFLTIYAILLFIGGAIFLDFEYRVSNALYMVFGLFPLFFIFYFELNKRLMTTIYINLFYSYAIISLLLFFLLYYGYFAWNRYQHVGNILAATAILSLGFDSKKKKWILFLVFFILCLLTGSRQSLAGILFVGLVFILLNKPKIVLISGAVIWGIIYNKDYFINLLSELAYEYRFITLNRLLVALNQEGGGSSITVRLEVYERLVDMLTLLPNLKFSPNIKELFPHNFFLEYGLTCGVIITLFFVIAVMYILITKILKYRKNVFLYFSLFYILPFMVSSGIAAAKYFLFFIILIFFVYNKTFKLKQ